MTVSTFAGTFQTGTGAIGTTIDITPSGCTISGTSVIFFFYNGRTEAVDTIGRATYFRGTGYAISTTDRRACCSQGVDANAAHDGGSRYTADGCIVSVVLESTEDGRLDFDSWLSNGARLIVDDVMPASRTIGYWLITGLTSAAGVEFSDQGTTGNFDITSLAFQPDVGIFVGPGHDAGAPHSRNGASKLSLGFGISSSKQAVWSGVEDEGSATADSDSYGLYGVEVIANHSASAGTTVNSRIGLVSWLSNGVRLNQIEVPTTIEYNWAVFLKGGSWTVEEILSRADGNDINTPSLGFTPTGVLAISAYKAEHTQDTATVHQTMSIGAAHGTSNRWAISLMDVDGAADTAISTGIEFDEIYQSITTSHAQDGLMDVKTWTDPITFVMDDADPSQKWVGLLIVGNVDSGNSVNKSESVTVSESAATEVSAPQINQSESITVSESASVNLPVVGTLSVSVTDSVTVSEAATASVVSTISKAENVTVSEAVTASVISAISKAENVTVSESMAAAVSAPQINQSESITVSEGIGINLPIAGSLSLSVSESITASEAISRNMGLAISQTENVTVSDALNAQTFITLALVENVTVSEALSLNLELAINRAENVTVSEALNAQTFVTLALVENVTVTENLASAVSAPLVSITDTITVFEEITAAPWDGNLSIGIFDQVLVTERVFSHLFNRYVAVASIVTESVSGTSTVWESVANDSVVYEAVAINSEVVP